MTAQKLWTKAIEAKAKKYPLYSQDGCGMDAKVLTKFFNPYGLGTWLITEAEWEESEQTWLLYGYFHLYEWEWGYITLKELESIRVNVFGYKMPLEREKYIEPLEYTVKQLVRE